MVDIVGLGSATHQPNRISDRPAAKGSAAKGKDSVSVSAGDRIEISAGRKEADAVNRLVQMAQSEPEVRAEAVARAKEKLANGEYEGIEVSRATAKKILGIG
ncbi:MAG: flagellar biosynthesis anti-sigma factor FlgM [bacterium]|jgi:anti-sigma28 factor (negative regulator of flagellin synthesis)|nr:flagellar biosynthesis anti-sigma factor FlgM [bacterium]